MQQELRFQCRHQRSLEAITWWVGRRCAGKLLRIKMRSLISPAHLPFRIKAPTEVLFTLNQPPSALVYFYHCLCQTTSPFVSNRHEVMLPVTGICPVVLLLCQPRQMYIKPTSDNSLWILLTKYPFNCTFFTESEHCGCPPYSVSPQISFRSSCVQAPSKQNPSLCERSRDSLTSSLFSILLLPSVGRRSCSLSDF